MISEDTDEVEGTAEEDILTMAEKRAKILKILRYILQIRKEGQDTQNTQVSSTVDKRRGPRYTKYSGIL